MADILDQLGHPEEAQQIRDANLQPDNATAHESVRSATPSDEIGLPPGSGVDLDEAFHAYTDIAFMFYSIPDFKALEIGLVRQALDEIRWQHIETGFTPDMQVALAAVWAVVSREYTYTQLYASNFPAAESATAFDQYVKRILHGPTNGSTAAGWLLQRSGLSSPSAPSIFRRQARRTYRQAAQQYLS